jgi:hypothetical protein
MSEPAGLTPEEGTPAQASVEQSNALTILQTVEHHHFSSLAEVSAYLKSLSPKERFEIVNEQASKLVAVQEKVDKYMEYLEDFVEGDGTFKDRMAHDPEVWTEISSGANRARASEKKKQQALRKCFKRWGENNVKYHFGHLLDAGGTTWSKIRRLATKEADVAVAVKRVRDAVYWRLTHGRPGRSSELYPVGADFEKTKDDELPAVDQATISAAGYGVDDRGWMVHAEKRLPVRVLGEENEDSSLSSLPSGYEGEVGENFDDDVPNRRPDLRLGQGKLAEDASPNADNSGAGRSVEVKMLTSGQALTEGVETDDYEADEEEDESDGDSGEDERPAKKRKRDATTPRQHKCTCADGVQAGFITRCSTKAINPGKQVQLVKEWVSHTDGGNEVCFLHSKNIASAIGMQTRNLNTVTVKERLRSYHQAILDNTIGDLKTDKGTYAWFRMADRPSRPSDRLGPYKLMPKDAGIFKISVDDQARLCTYLGIDSESWDEVGSVVVDCFDWWATQEYTGTRMDLAERTILEVILEEFEMYHAHLRLINKKPNYGWLRNMYYSLGQQVMRQDPKYFAIYCALRPDQNTNLVSYPYYAKYARKGDNTFFRHIDLNIGDLASSGRGANMIQGTVSLDDEKPDDCTMILPGMHKHIKEWDETLTARGLSTRALVHRIQDSMFTSEDEKRFGTKWTSQPCQRGQVRVTLPHLPHGAYGPAKGERRTMLPWFCGLQNDLETLEVIESGTWSDLSVAHRDMVAARLSPSGLANRYGAIPFAFPASVLLEGLGALSGALVCRQHHDMCAVVSEKKRLLTGTRAEVNSYLEKWRKVAVNCVCEAFEDVKEGEMERFGEKSYFYRKMNGLSPADSDDDPDLVGDDVRAHGFEEPEEEDVSALEGEAMEVDADEV